jgi:hypothetical protein
VQLVAMLAGSIQMAADGLIMQPMDICYMEVPY